METEFANQPIEIQHWGRYDVLINRELPDQQTVNNLVVKIKSDYDAAPDQNLFETWTSREGQKTNVLFDRVENPHYCAKSRWISEYIKKELQEDILKVNSRELITLKEAQTFDSLMSELRLYNQLRRAISSAEFQKVATDRGFSELKTTPPLIGLINRDTWQKTIIYPFIDGPSLDKSGQVGNFEAKSIASELSILFSEEGIVANDLENRVGDPQFMFTEHEGKKTLYLVDLEGYYPKVKNKSN